MTLPEKALLESNLTSLKLLHRGKVRDIYAVDENKLLIIQTDRLSAFDVILPTPVPGKGKVLTAMSNFWFRKLEHVMPNHLTGVLPESLISTEELDQVLDRAFVVRRLKPLPIEAIVRGYVVGSGWKDYRKTGAICGITLPAGLQEASKLPNGAIFTPSTKAEMGAHDENISFLEAEKLLGNELAIQVRDKAIALYTEAA
ncbi:MAG: phosphoribosylaminoimidazolesuccinocarboxamide synthase, partial [Nitrosomonadales bacterium]